MDEQSGEPEKKVMGEGTGESEMEELYQTEVDSDSINNPIYRMQQ